MIHFALFLSFRICTRTYRMIVSMGQTYFGTYWVYTPSKSQDYARLTGLPSTTDGNHHCHNMHTSCPYIFYKHLPALSSRGCRCWFRSRYEVLRCVLRYMIRLSYCNQAQQEDTRCSTTEPVSTDTDCWDAAAGEKDREQMVLDLGTIGQPSKPHTSASCYDCNICVWPSHARVLP